LEAVELLANVSKVDMKHLATTAEIPNDVENLFPRFLKHLRHRPLAEIDPVVFARRDLNETLETLHAPQNGLDSAKSLVAGHAGIVRMAGHTDFVFLRDRNDALQEVRNTLPVLLCTNRPGLGQCRILLRLFVCKRAVSGYSPARFRFCPHYSH